MALTTMTLALGALSKIFKLGLAAYKVGEKWGLSAEELGALEGLVGATQGVVGLFAGGSGPAPSTRLIALHTAVVTRAFAAAFRDHWAGNAALAPTFAKRPWLARVRSSAGEAQRAEEIETRLRGALGRMAKQGEGGAAKAFEALGAVLEEPVGSPAYEALWYAFTNERLEDELERIKPLELDDPGAKLEFERTFRLRYAEALSASNEFARAIFELRPERARLLRELVVRGVSTWKQRHVFASVEASGVPTMPLGEIYVEPNAIYQQPTPQTPITRPIRELVRTLLEAHKIVIVRGDFGQGKSLTARTLACEAAETYVCDKASRSTDLWYPVFVKCSEDFPNHEPALKRIVARALQRQAREIKIDLPEDDEALSDAAGVARTLYLIDGLDEVALTHGEVESFFRDLAASIGGTGRAIVFSRKGAIPHSEKLAGIPIVDVEQFETSGPQPGGQVAAWLERWNRLSGRSPITIEQVEQRKLLEIARTPILLFMAAMTWDEARADGAEVTRAEIYERFFLQIATGKCDQDHDSHDPVANASQRLLERLVEMGEVEKPRHGVPDRTSRALAMLWMLGRVAWESQRCAYRGEELTLHEVTGILKDDLGLRNEASALELVRFGVLLVLQADHQGGNDRILFGHKSFREFLVARHWVGRLERIVAARKHDRRADLTRQLLGARLLGDDDESLSFLTQIVNGPTWNSAQRMKLVEWASDCFNGEEPGFADAEKPTWRTDRRPPLREAALAIGSSVDDTPSIRVEDPSTLRSMLAWFWATGTRARVVARGIDHPGASLHEAALAGACFEGANFRGAIFDDAWLLLAAFAGADLEGARLNGATLTQADLTAANLSEAQLDGAYLVDAFLRRANLAGARLIRTDLGGAHFEEANLRGTVFIGANLRGASFEKTNLSSADLRNAEFDSTTRWPGGFDPVEAGAQRVPSEIEALASSVPGLQAASGNSPGTTR